MTASLSKGGWHSCQLRRQRWIRPTLKKASTTTRFRKWISGDRVFPWALVLPGALLLLILAIGPTLYVFVPAFLKYTPGQPIQFAGLNNSIGAFKTDRFFLFDQETEQRIG